MAELLKDVTLSAMTLRHVPILDRIEAAGKAGFGGIGARLSDYEDAVNDGYSLNAIDEKLEEHDVRVTEIEFLRNWIGRQGNREYRQQEEQVLELANHWNAHHMNIGFFKPSPPAVIALSLAGLCKRALETRPTSEDLLLILSEFMPYTPPINTLSRARLLNKAVNQPNAKLLIDTWHANRTAGAALDLIITPPNEVGGIQLSDSRSKPMSDLTEESRHYREIPGEGSGSLEQWVTAIRKLGIAAPFSAEVMSDTLDRSSPIEVAARVADGVRKVLKGSLSS